MASSSGSGWSRLHKSLAGIEENSDVVEPKEAVNEDNKVNNDHYSRSGGPQPALSNLVNELLPDKGQPRKYRRDSRFMPNLSIVSNLSRGNPRRRYGESTFSTASTSSGWKSVRRSSIS